MAMAGDRPGPAIKGDRVPMHVRVERAHRSVYEDAADELGLPLGDYVALVLAREHDLNVPPYIRRRAVQNEQLPLASGL